MAQNFKSKIMKKIVDELLELMNQVKIDSMTENLTAYRERLLRMKAEHSDGGNVHLMDAHIIEIKILEKL